MDSQHLKHALKFLCKFFLLIILLVSAPAHAQEIIDNVTKRNDSYAHAQFLLCL